MFAGHAGLSGARFIAARDLKHMLGQRETLVWVFVMPVLFFYFIGTVTGGGGSSGTAKDRIALRTGVEPGFLADDLAARLEQVGYEVVREPQSGDAPELSLELPAHFTAQVQAGEQQKLALSVGDDSRGARFHELRVGRAVYGLLADLLVVADERATYDATSRARIAAEPRKLSVELSAAGRRTRMPTGFDQAVPGTMVMFTMIVLLTSGAILLVMERDQGLLRRLASAPISRAQVVLGKWISRMTLAVVQIAFAMTIGRLAFHVDWGPSLPMVFACLLGWAALCASLALLLGSLARNSGQAAAIGVLSSNVLAALGGCWWPIEITPRWMQKLALCLPTGWSMDALHRLVTFQNGAGDAVVHLAALLGAAGVVGVLAARAFRYH